LNPEGPVLVGTPHSPANKKSTASKMNFEPICDTVFAPWAPKDFEEYDAGPCGQCNWYGAIGEYNGFEVYNCEHGHWFTVKEEEDISDSPLLVGDVGELYRRMAAAGPNAVWGEMAWEDDQEFLANETSEEKTKRLAIMAEKDRTDKKEIVKSLVRRKEEKWTKGGEMKFRVPRPCKYATCFEQRICAGCSNKVPIGQTHCQADLGHRTCGQELAGCWNHDQHKTCIYIHPDEPQWTDACSGRLNYDRQSQTFFIQGQAAPQVNRFTAAARSDARAPRADTRAPNGRPPVYGGPREAPRQQGVRQPRQGQEDGWEQAKRRR